MRHLVKFFIREILNVVAYTCGFTQLELINLTHLSRSNFHKFIKFKHVNWRMNYFYD